MPKDNSQLPETSWGSEEKTWWTQRSLLEKRLLIALGVIVVLALGFMIYAGIKRKPTSDASDSCSSPGCLKAAAQIITHINPEIDPCDDFFKFACGRYIEFTHGDIKAASVQRVEEQVQRQFDEIIREPINEDDHFAIQMDKTLFQACMNETAVEEESLEIFKKHLKQLNGWPVTIGFQWKGSQFDWTQMIGKLRMMGYPYRILMDVQPIHDPVDSDKFILFISEPYTFNVKKEHRELYVKYMSEVAKVFGATDNVQLSLEMQKALDFGEKLGKVAKKNIWDMENETDTNITARLLETRFTIEDFQANHEEIDWLEFLSMVAYPMNVSASDYAIFPNDEFLEEFAYLIHNTPKKVQANYIIWTILDHLIPFFPKKLKYLEANYTCQTQQDGSTLSSRFEYCKRVLRGTILPEPSNIIYARRYLPPEKREKVQELLGSIKTEFKTLLLENSWMDDETKEKAVEKADAITEIIGAPGDYFDDAVFEKYDTISYDEDESFLHMVLKRSKHENDVMFARIQADINDTSEDVFYDLTTRVNAMYSPFDNALILPTGILQGVFYNPDRPMYLNYGAIGSIIGHELTHGFSKDSSKYDKDGKQAKMWSEETEKAYDEIAQCMIKDAEDFDVEDTEQTINGTQTLEENIADFAGIKASYAAYQTWVEENGEEPQLPGVEYTPNQLFWISAIAYECYKLSGERLEKGLERDSHAHNAFRATAPMRNNDDFANDFNCPVDSKMNPSEKCQVF